MAALVFWFEVSRWGGGLLVECAVRGGCVGGGRWEVGSGQWAVGSGQSGERSRRRERERQRRWSVLAYLDENDVGAGLGEGYGDGGTYATGCARYEGGLALEGEESVGGHVDGDVVAD